MTAPTASRETHGISAPLTRLRLVLRAPSRPLAKLMGDEEYRTSWLAWDDSRGGQDEDTLMARPRKFEALVVPEPGAFTAQVVRQRTSSSTRIERMAGGFATKAEGYQWASAQLDEHLAGRAETRAKRKHRDPANETV